MKSWKYLLSMWVGDAAGVAAIEFGLLVPIIILMAIAAVDLGMGFYHKMQVEGAAQSGAEWAIKNGFDANAISSAVTAATVAPVVVSPAPAQFCGCPTASGVATSNCGIPCSSGAMPGNYTTVSAQMTYNTIINYGIFPSTFNLTSQSTVRLQ